MTTKYKFLSKMIGQEAFKREVSFLLDGFEKTDYLAAMCLVAPKGTGKSMAAKAIGAELSKITKEKYGEKKWFIEINCSEIKSADVFFTQLFPLLVENKYCTLFLDELPNAGPSFITALLTILNPTEKRKNDYFLADGTKFTFDFTKLTVLCATTAPNLVHPDLLDRLRRVELGEFQINELAEIIRSKAKGINIAEDVLQEVAKVVRANARQAVLKADDIKSCGVTEFGRKEWEHLKYSLNIMPLGLSKIEVQYLKLLRTKPATLTELSSRLNLPNAVVQQDIENNLRRCGLFRTAGTKGRVLTPEGQEVLGEIDKISC